MASPLRDWRTASCKLPVFSTFAVLTIQSRGTIIVPIIVPLIPALGVIAGFLGCRAGAVLWIHTYCLVVLPSRSIHMNFRYALIVLAFFLSMPCLALQSAARDVADATISEGTTSTGTTIGTADTLKTRTKSNQTNERVVSEHGVPVVVTPASVEGAGTADALKTRTKSNNANERVVSEPMAPLVAVPASTETADSKKRNPAKPKK